MNAIKDCIKFLSENKLGYIIQKIKERDIPVFLQLVLYGCCGVAATILSTLITITLSKSLIPAFEGMEYQGALISDTQRAQNLLKNNCIAFFITNFFVYYMNVLLVFKQGRHSPLKEFLLFTAVNTFSFALSQIAGPWLIHQFSISTGAAIGINVFFSALLNFIARKFFVFKG